MVETADAAAAGGGEKFGWLDAVLLIANVAVLVFFELGCLLAW